MTTASLRNDCQDREVERRILNFLGSRRFASFDRLRVDVLDGHVTIRGHLDSYYEKQVALHTCQRVAGVIDLVDQIEVDG